MVNFCSQESSVIHSNANLGVHGQGLLNLSGPGDCIEAQRLVLSLFYGINVSILLIIDVQFFLSSFKFRKLVFYYGSSSSLIFYFDPLYTLVDMFYFLSLYLSSFLMLSDI